MLCAALPARRKTWRRGKKRANREVLERGRRGTRTVDSAERGRGERSVHPNRKKAKTATKGWVVDESNQEAFCKTVLQTKNYFLTESGILW